MSDILPTNFVGTSMAAVQNQDGLFRIYFQNKDYQICEMSLNDPNSTTNIINKLTTNTMPAARINTPIAAAAWDNFKEIRVYYITVNSEVQEMCYSFGAGWYKGGHLGTAVGGSTCLYAQFLRGDPGLRVGFQSSTAPQTITEARCFGDGWKTRVF